MPNDPLDAQFGSTDEAHALLDSAVDRLEDAWRAGSEPELARFVPPREDPRRLWILIRLILVDQDCRKKANKPKALNEYMHEFKELHDHPAAAKELQELAATSGYPHRRDVDLPPGYRLDHYEIKRLLGRGGMGAVYLAHDLELDYDVAIKIPHRGVPVDAILGEARAVARLRHPGIVAVHYVGRDKADIPFIVMDYIHGCSLKAFLDSGEKPSFERITKLIASVADAIHFAHLQGFTHRDLKPGNVLLDQEGKAHVADFGLAVHESVQRDLKGQVAGTLPYMSPEQVRGDAHRLDGRADVWAMGVILYEMLALRRPFDGNTPEELIHEILERAPKPPRMIVEHICEDLEHICLKCLRKTVDERYSTAADVATALRRLEPLAVPSATPLPQSTSRGPRLQGGVELRFGRFRLLVQIGFGAMGAIWKAMDEYADKTVEITIQHCRTAEERDSFVKAWEKLPQLRHPGIVWIRDVLHEGDDVCIVRDYIEGKDLRDLSFRSSVAHAEIVRLGVKLARTLHYAHVRGVVHGDLGPTRIIVDRNGEPHIRDFAWHRGGGLVGTPCYSAPEVWTCGEQGLDGRSDVYSLGVILYELFTGRLPYDRQDPTYILTHGDDVDVGGLPRNLAAICLKCMKVAPSNRYASAQELADDLKRFLHGNLVNARCYGLMDRIWHYCCSPGKWIRRLSRNSQGEPRRLPTDQDFLPSQHETPSADVPRQGDLHAVLQLRILEGPNAGMVIPLRWARVLVGRSPECEVCLSDLAVSRGHFSLNWDSIQRAFVLVDHGARNPVQVNGQMVRAHLPLGHGDRIAVGSTSMILEEIAT